MSNCNERAHFNLLGYPPGTEVYKLCLERRNNYVYLEEADQIFTALQVERAEDKLRICALKRKLRTVREILTEQPYWSRADDAGRLWAEIDRAVGK